MMRIILILILVFVSFNCANNEFSNGECNINNPLEMKWLAQKIDETQNCVCTTAFFQAEYMGETVFYQMIYDPLCSTIIDNVPVYNCKGEELMVLKNITDWNDFSDNVSCFKIIYSCKKPERN